MNLHISTSCFWSKFYTTDLLGTCQDAKVCPVYLGTSIIVKYTHKYGQCLISMYKSQTYSWSILYILYYNVPTDLSIWSTISGLNCFPPPSNFSQYFHIKPQFFQHFFYKHIINLQKCPNCFEIFFIWFLQNHNF